MATENIIMNQVKAGGDRQELHEKIRQHSMEAARTVKEKGLPNDLVDRITQDSYFDVTKEELQEVLKPENYIGRAPSQVTEFLEHVVSPLLERNKELLGLEAEINV